jgi:EAL domain-containing protein (putative c-di-GMP-specific phosphodiesterase class I)
MSWQTRPATGSPRFSIAFQPIVDLTDGTVYAYEALVRGPDGEEAETVFSSVGQDEAMAFDAACRETAVKMAAALGLRCRLSLNISALAICDYRFGLHATLKAAERCGWAPARLIFEMTEQDRIPDIAKLGRWVSAARNRGVTVAIDDFGAGYAGLSSLLQLRPSMVKLDMSLVRGIDTCPARRAMVRGIVETCATFDCRPVAEGIETEAEATTLHGFGIELMQGYFFARPALARLPSVDRIVGNAAPDHRDRGPQARRASSFA